MRSMPAEPSDNGIDERLVTLRWAPLLFQLLDVLARRESAGQELVDALDGLAGGVQAVQGPAGHRIDGEFALLLRGQDTGRLLFGIFGEISMLLGVTHCDLLFLVWWSLKFID
jgi:hypothetical protein